MKTIFRFFAVAAVLLTVAANANGQIYSVRMRDIDMKVSRITVVYTSVKPE